jgi:hypothetical protein
MGLLGRAGGAFAAAAAPTPTPPPAPAPNKPVAEDPNKPETIIVARIGDYTITKAQLKEQVAQEALPQRESEPNRVVRVPDVLDEMLAERAMMIEGRKNGLLDNKDIRPFLQRTRRDNLITLMLRDYVTENIVVTDADVQEMQKTDPNLTPERARMMVQRKKADPVLNQFYAGLLTKFKVQKVKENFQKVAQIHQRLLTQPAKSRGQGVSWITATQIEEELTKEEKDLPLATFEGGRLPLTEWLLALDSMIPPNRPKNLDTAEGVDKFTDFALQGPVLMAEAVARGYDKNPKHIEYMRAVEDNQLFNKVLGDKCGNIPEPNDSEVKPYFDKNPSRFSVGASIKIDQIWCKDLATAQKVKEKLLGGAPFEAVKNEQSLRKEEPVHDTWPPSEGIFWEDLRKGEPNSIVGPVKGFFDPRIKWRIVKVLDKKPAVARPYSDEIKNNVKEAIMNDRIMKIRRDFEKEILAKYPHEVYAEKIKDIDPLEVSPDDSPVR